MYSVQNVLDKKERYTHKIYYHSRSCDRIINESYFFDLGRDQKYHRDDGPAIVEYYERNPFHKSSEGWYRHGKKHRIDGPAISRWLPKGDVFAEYWYIEDSLHRPDGPAVKLRKSTGIEQNWYIHGVNVTDKVNNIINFLKLRGEYIEWSNESKMLFRLMLDG